MRDGVVTRSLQLLPNVNRKCLSAGPSPPLVQLAYATRFDLGMAHRCQDLRASCRVWTVCGSNVDELSRIRRVPTGGVYRMLIALDLRLRLAS
jgi:hypothetical protein